MAVQMAVRVVKARLRGAGKPECEAEGGGERAVKESVYRRRAGRLWNGTGRWEEDR